MSKNMRQKKETPLLNKTPEALVKTIRVKPAALRDETSSGVEVTALPLAAKGGEERKAAPKKAAAKPRKASSKAATPNAVGTSSPEAFLSDFDLHLLGEGNHFHSYTKLGAHIVPDGVHFAVWAPGAQRVSVVGDFNQWNGDSNPMQHRSNGIWSLQIDGLQKGTLYKYEITDEHGAVLPLKADPYAFYSEQAPGNASIVWPLPDVVPYPETLYKNTGQTRNDPVSIYEVHLGSWKRADGNRHLTYRELAEDLVPYVRDLGFTHIELLPITEHPFDGSWGYQPTGLYAPTSRYGTPDDFRAFVQAAHDAGLKVIVDWVAGHFPNDPHGLAGFNGTHLYDHADPRQGFHQDWNTHIYNYGRNEVRNFLLSNALFWIERYGVDGLRVDAVASMIYLNYSREEGQWIPNQFGGVENLEATAFLRRMNELVYGRFPHALTAAEESTAWPQVSHPTEVGGLGFGFKWNMGWMHDTLRYMSKDPIHRRYHHNDLTFGLLYGFSENFILPLSHDEVVHGKGSILRRMPGDDWQKFANLRAYYAFMFTHPGKKLLFMGGEFGQWDEWNHNQSLDWHLLEHAPHHGVQALIRALNGIYRTQPALHRLDCQPEGFEWLESDAAEASVLLYARKGETPDELVIVACNFTPEVRHDYRIPAPLAGTYQTLLNTDEQVFGGSGFAVPERMTTEDIPHHSRPASFTLSLPPLSTVVLKYQRG